MNKEHLEQGADVRNTQEENNYQRYQELGGIINEDDYRSALTKAKDTVILDEALIKQAKDIAKFAGIELDSAEDAIDPRITLYGILRRDVRPKEVKYHHDQMSDQRIFVEALRMLCDVGSLEKMVKMYPHISFEYQATETEPTA